MNNLINFLFANLIPIVVVVSIVLRIYAGMKNNAGARRNRTAPVQEQDEEDETAGEGSRLGEEGSQPRFYLAESAPPRQSVSHAPASSLVPLPEISPLDSAPPAGFVPAEGRPGLRQAAIAPVEPVPGLFHRIAALRPMQQALVLSEILGPPKGLL
jgi:hypothetical protein